MQFFFWGGGLSAFRGSVNCEMSLSPTQEARIQTHDEERRAGGDDVVLWTGSPKRLLLRQWTQSGVDVCLMTLKHRRGFHDLLGQIIPTLVFCGSNDNINLYVIPLNVYCAVRHSNDIVVQIMA